jgi:hypothetical protein
LPSGCRLKVPKFWVRQLRRNPERVCPGPNLPGTASYPLGPLGKAGQIILLNYLDQRSAFGCTQT